MSLGATLTRPDTAASEAVSQDIQQDVGFLDFSQADPLLKANERQKSNIKQPGSMSLVMARQVPAATGTDQRSALPGQATGAPAPAKGFFRKAAPAEAQDFSHR